MTQPGSFPCKASADSELLPLPPAPQALEEKGALACLLLLEVLFLLSNQAEVGAHTHTGAWAHTHLCTHAHG